MTGLAINGVEEARLEAASAWCLALAEGELSPGEQARFSAWLQANAANRAAFEDAAAVWDGVVEISLSPSSLALRREALAAFAQQRRGRRGRGRAWSIGRIAAVLVAGLMLLGGGSWWLLRPSVLQTGTGERRVVMLDDGSRVSMDAATRIRVQYSGHRRRLWLDRGRAKFDVAHDADRPFTVSAAGKLVRATGTQFSVELLGGDIRVVLYEGRVVVRAEAGQDRALVGRENPAAGSAQAVLSPGQELVSPAAASTLKVAATDPVRSLAWEAGQLIFVDEPLASAVERVNRYAGARLVVDDAKAAEVRVDGVFAAGDNDAFVEGVTGILPVRALRTGETVHFASKDPER